MRRSPPTTRPARHSSATASGCWSRAADELHDARELSDELWAQLSEQLSEVELIELCMLVGHYEMLAMTLNSLRVQPDEFSARGVPKIVRLASRR